MSKSIHIVGICGTFMGGVAKLAKELGFTVTGSDANTYPPMSTQLEALGVELYEGYSTSNIPKDVNQVIIGNSISRGNPELETTLDKGLNYTSGAQWLSEQVLRDRWVIAVSGTHGKTTTASLLAWLLEDNGLEPGFLIGGVPENFGTSAQLGDSPFFVIEADEYDTAFSDKRSKFIHYHPRTLIINNLEFDHADIFDDLKAIQTQFHHLLKIIPNSGLVIYNSDSEAIMDVLDQGLWCDKQSFGVQADWSATALNASASKISLKYKNQEYQISWPLIGHHNMSNAVAAIAAARHVGVPIEHSCESLARFKSVKRRLELIYENELLRIYDDFAHHPTAIGETVNALRNLVNEEQIYAVLEPRSNTMKRGVHKDQLAGALKSANKVFIYADNQVLWDVSELEAQNTSAFSRIKELENAIYDQVELDSIGLKETQQASKINILIMSNGGFQGLHQNLVNRLKSPLNI